MQAPEEYQYTAFISYCHRQPDTKWALWLQECLETFETPPTLVEKGYSKALGKVFVDDTEMSASSDLSGQIKQALWQARNLIVICSSSTPSSKWVRAEISLFKHWGREDRIFTLLVEGDPQTAFPPELLSWQMVGDGPDATMELKEPAGASVADLRTRVETELKALARDKFASQLLGCEFGELRDRQIERVRKITTTRYFRDIVKRWGIPEGVAELTEAQAKQRHASYRIESRNDRVQRVSIINNRLHLKGETNDTAEWYVSYRSNDSVDTVDRVNRNGRVISRENFSPDGSIIDFSHEDQTAIAQVGYGGGMGFSDKASEELQETRSLITRHLLTHDENGFVVKKLYARDAFNTPARDVVGNYGEAYNVNANGQKTKTWYLDVEGDQDVERTGVASRKCEYEDEGNRVAWYYLDDNGAPINSSDNYAISKCRFDSVGNVIEYSVFDKSGDPTLCEHHYFKDVNSIDSNGNWTEQCYFDCNNQPTLNKQGYAKLKLRYDECGYESEQAFYNLDDNPTMHRDGFASFSSIHDVHGNLIEHRLFGNDGKPILHKNGYARFNSVYDISGNCIEQTHFDTKDNPTLHKDGYARIAVVYNDRGNVTEQSYYDINNKPTLIEAGFFRLKWSYDLRGNRIKESHFGIDSCPVLSRDGYASYISDFNSQGKLIGQAYYCVDGKPVLNKDGYARLTYAYDTRGSCTEEIYFDINGDPVLAKYGYARVSRLYDSINNCIEEAYYGADDNPVLRSGEFARITFSYDRYGRCSGESYFGVDGNSILRNDGLACLSVVFDVCGNEVECCCFGTEGEPVLNTEGYHYQQNNYDELNRLSAIKYHDIDRKPINRLGGYSRFVITRNEFGEIIEKTYYDLSNNKVIPPPEHEGNERD